MQVRRDLGMALMKILEGLPERCGINHRVRIDYDKAAVESDRKQVEW